MNERSLEDIKHGRIINLYLWFLALSILLVGCAQSQLSGPSTEEPTPTQTVEQGLIACSDDMIFCKDLVEWTCPGDNEYFVFCRDVSKISPDVCEKEGIYMQWFLENCPNVKILE